MTPRNSTRPAPIYLAAALLVGVMLPLHEPYWVLFRPTRSRRIEL